MIRLLAFAHNASDALAFGRGISTDDEPDLWAKDLTGVIDLWIEVGQPEEQRIRKACGRAGLVRIYTFSGRSADLWWQKNAASLDRCGNLEVFGVPTESSRELAALAGRNMRLQCLVQDGQIQFMNDASAVAIDLLPLKRRG